MPTPRLPAHELPGATRLSAAIRDDDLRPRLIATALSDRGNVVQFGRAWNPKPKIVFSSTLPDVGWNSRLVRGDPVEELSRIRDEFQGDLEISGPTLARPFVERGLIDRYDLVVHPVALGAGTPFFPKLDSPLHLRLVATHTFANGALHLGYEPIRG